MGYSKFEFGALYLNEIEQWVPQNPINEGDIMPYKNQQRLYIGENFGSSNRITWIKPDGMGILIADRVLLSAISWQDIKLKHLSSGKNVSIFDRGYLCRLPLMEEWNTALDTTTSAIALWHWNDMGSLTKSVSIKSNTIPKHVYVGKMGPYFRGTIPDSMKSVNVGFRPVLEVTRIRDGKTKPNCVLDGENFMMAQIPGEVHGFTPTLTPVSKPLFRQIPNGTELKMYTLLHKGKPVCLWPQNKDQFSKEDVRNFQLTDKYFGDEYLVQWIICNGMAIASKALVDTEE